MPSKTIVRSDALTRQVVAGALETSEEVATFLRERLNPLLEEGENPPDWALIQRLAGRLIASGNQRLLDLDFQLEQERTSDKKLRAEREELADALRGELRSARFLLDESFGKELGAGLFRWRKLAKLRARPLVLAAQETAGSLRQPQAAGKALRPKAGACRRQKP